jgi:hypothetical protein
MTYETKKENNVTKKPTNATNSSINMTKNTTNEGKKIEYEVRQQIEDIQVGTLNMTNVTKDYADEVKSALKDASN